MVKNTNGGKYAKSFARKSSQPTKSSLFIPEPPIEQFAVVSKFYGNKADVITHTGLTLNCFIRGKFKGKYKKNNFVQVNAIIAVALRDFEEPNYKNCDLIEVYKPQDIPIISKLPNINISNLTKFIQSNTIFGLSTEKSDDVYFDFDNDSDGGEDKCEEKKLETTTEKADTAEELFDDVEGGMISFDDI
jgi:hypothetical protein